ncbi:adenosylmethionine--8-amino-7-oxononanoate transaminase [Prosthecobacter sp.]|uniref:adenosylmethionine--8-amino-7-oxononanoate transaminase n=1 Tax=Prosthecobacter sp. TaxID=1965333 RepID=UPI0025E780A1|nr:adenosylmethionine--8-amino-7-oxononanoate transaminase [Prosthecobacter sp.]
MTDLIALDKRHLWHPFTPMQPWCSPDHEPLLLVSGNGCTLRDQHGREYLDGNASIWTNIHGHGHPVINEAIIEQLGKVAHTSFLGFTHEPAIRLAKELVDLVPGGKLTRAFFTDNGSTAIESAVRMALQFWKQNGRQERDTLIAFDRAYHGDTLGAASLGGIPLFKGSGNDFGYRVVTVSSMDELAGLAADRVAAVILEPLIQGAAGMRLWPQGMLKSLDAWCDAHDVFLILDEVMTGFGRTGKMFACEHEDVVPDFLCLAKGITGGYLPFAATLTTERVFEGFLGDPGEGRTFFYGHSYAGSQLGCAAALASLRVFRDERVLEQLPAKIARLRDGLRDLPAFRQCGMIAAITVDSPDPSAGVKICLAARKHGLLTRPVGNTIVLMPPLCVTLGEIDRMTAALRAALAEVAPTESTA